PPSHHPADRSAPAWGHLAPVTCSTPSCLTMHNVLPAIRLLRTPSSGGMSDEGILCHSIHKHSEQADQIKGRPVPRDVISLHCANGLAIRSCRICCASYRNIFLLLRLR